MTGCVLTVDPVVPGDEATFDPRLLGSWKDVDGSDVAVVSSVDKEAYAIEYSHDGTTSHFKARLGHLGDRLILDVWPTPPGDEMPELYVGVFIPGHLLLVLDIGDEEIQVAGLNRDAFVEALDAGQVQLDHHSNDNRVTLYGATDELRGALSPYLSRTEALDAPSTWRRTEGAGVPGEAVRPVDVLCFEASAWREADRLFHRDPHWLGGDCASSVDLGGGRTLWLFGDTWIDPSGEGTRQGARMVGNSVAIQTGTDPSAADIEFHWGKVDGGEPGPFIGARIDERLWPGNGVLVDDRLVLFFNRTISTDTGLGFDSAGWTAVMVEDPAAKPSEWQVRTLDTPSNPLGIIVGFAAVLRLGDRVYALGSQNPVKSHPIYVARWPVEEVYHGRLMKPEWWAGERLGWVDDSSGAPRWPLFENGQTELAVHLDPATGRFLAVQTQGFGPADVMMRAAPALTGPWTEPHMLYRPPEYRRPNVMIYAAKAHPQLAGADLVLTYATNTFEFAEHFTDSRVYYPRFVRLTRCE
jgi:hypothetical protein